MKGTSSPVCRLAWAKLCPCLSQASSFHRVTFFGHVPITSYNVFCQGSTTMIIVPLTTIKLQLEADCQKLGFSALVGDQVLQDWLGNVHHLHQPLPPLAAPLWAFVSQHLFLSTSQKILRGSCWSVPQCSSSLLSSWRQPWYFLSNFQDFPKPIIKVRDTLMNVGLANNGKRPVVAIDECQVLNVN